MDAYSIQKFEQEAKILKALDVSGVPKFYEYFWHHNVPTIVMEFISGKPCNECYKNGLSEDEAKWIVVELCKVLSIVHERNLLHRDVTPQNIMVSEQPKKLWLIDFGVAKELIPSERYKQQTVIGKVYFMAPEQFIGKASFSSDLYGLGATVLALHLQANFLPNTYCAWEESLQHCNYTAPFKNILKRLVAPKVEDRFQSCQEVQAQCN